MAIGIQEHWETLNLEIMKKSVTLENAIMKFHGLYL